MKLFFLVATVAMITEKFSFFIAVVTIVRETNSFMKIMQSISPNYP